MSGRGAAAELRTNKFVPRITYSLNEVSSMIGLSPRTLHESAAAGKLKILRIGNGRGRWKVTVDDLIAYLKTVGIDPPRWLVNESLAIREVTRDA